MKDMRIKEGIRSKGGLNKMPSTPRPESPKPQTSIISVHLKELQERTEALWGRLNRSEVSGTEAVIKMALILCRITSYLEELEKR